MIVDERVPRGCVREWARQLRELPPAAIAGVNNCFRFDQPDDFYAGLLAGLSACESIRQAGQPHLIPALVAIVADVCDRKELAE